MAKKRDKAAKPPGAGLQPPHAAGALPADTQSGYSSEEQYRKIFEEGPLGMAIVGLDHHLLNVNDTLCRMLSYPKSKLIGLRFEDITHPEDIGIDVALAERLYRGDIPFYQIEKRYLRNDKSIFWGRLTASVIRTPSGEASHGLGLIEDITERKRAEEKLIESELRFRELAENVREVFWLVSPDWNEVIYISPAYEEVWGKSCASLKANPRSWVDSVAPEDFDKVLADIKARSAGDFTVAEGPEFRVIRPDGSVRWLQSRAFPVKNERGDIMCVAGICEDITTNKQAREALRATNEKLQAVIHASPLAIFVLDPDSNVQLWNPAAERIFGWTAQESVGHFLPIIPEEALEAHQALREQVLRGEAFSGLELRRRKKDGTPIDISVSTAPLRDAQGKITGIMAVNEDISDRKQAEEARRKAEAELQLVLSTISDYLWSGEIDTQGNFVQRYVSPVAEKITGRPPEFFMPDIGHWLSIVHPDDQSRVIEACTRIQKGEVKEEESEYRIILPDGTIRWVCDSATASKLTNGNISVNGVVSNITARKRAEEAMRQSEANLAAAQRIAHIGSWQWDVVTDSASWSDETYHVFGLNPGRLTEHRQGFLDMVHPEDRSRVDQALHDALEGTRAYDLEYRIVLPDKTEKYIHSRAEVIYAAAGRPVMMRGFIHDITERKRAEEALRQANEQLREADQRKDEFLAMLSHELRNPLAPLRSAIEILRLTGAKDPILQRQRNILDRQVTHMARLLDELLDVARINYGKIEINKQPLHLVDVIVHAIETATPLIESRHQTLHITPPPDTLRIEADIDRMAQVIGNLLTNAAKYTDEGGQIWLEAGREGTEALVRVRDNGVGITPEMLPRVFDLFAQANHSLARTQGGLGIGLKMVLSLVQMHGGSVKAHSEGLGKGSEFTIRLPALPDEEQAPVWQKEPAEKAPQSPSRRILVVDDLIDTSESLAEVLEVWGHEVRTAHDGLAALKAASIFHPEIVILDIGMPGMDGYEVARRLRQDGCTALLFALTGYGQESDRKMAFDSGFDQFMIKPVDLATLRKQLA